MLVQPTHIGDLDILDPVFRNGTLLVSRAEDDSINFQCGVVVEDCCMAFVLKMFELAQHHRVPEMQVGCGGIDAELDAQRLARNPRAFELGAQLFFRNDFGGAFAQRRDLLVYGSKCVRCSH